MSCMQNTEPKTIRVQRGFDWTVFRRTLEDHGWHSVGQWFLWAAGAWLAAPFGPERVGLARRGEKDGSEG